MQALIDMNSPFLQVVIRTVWLIIMVAALYGVMAAMAWADKGSRDLGNPIPPYVHGRL
jgi:hypothetical protein